MIGWYGCGKEAEAGYGLRVASYGLRVASYGLRVTCCELRVTGYVLRVTGYGLRVLRLRISDFGCWIDWILTRHEGGGRSSLNLF